MNERADVVVVGAGVVGLSAACELAARGAGVVVVDASPRGGDGSRAAAGVAVPSLRLLTDPVLARFVDEAAARLHADVATAGPPLRLGERVLRPAWTAGERAELERAAQRAPAALGRWLEPDELRACEPVLDGADVLGGFAVDRGYVVDTDAYLDSLARRCAVAGAEIVLGCPVLEIRDGAPATVRAERRSWTAEQVVVAAGPWSGRIGGLPPLPVRPVRGQIVELACAGMPLRSVVSGRTYVCPAADARIGVGSTEEAAGFDDRVTAAGVAFLLAKVVSRFPRLRDATFAGARAGLRAATPDGRPSIGRYPGTSRVLVGTGHGGQGILTGPYTGWALAELVERRAVDLPAEFDPGRTARPDGAR
ncbi:NAD(P)/FAD-dependent oxidoreductase [Actinoplanes siamensis]|uniref:Glycine oxidase ThiO n=1 Tax=Actinoplanes siamensis TaxID=1223317 RepID=A0A919N6V3_9ACTN|nr:FAD-dependent oxidoreductase [Actinoplanes siamensis]GIF05432.1 glycine oxidase ThiO [Actinoplanes siamensis]